MVGLGILLPPGTVIYQQGSGGAAGCAPQIRPNLADPRVCVLPSEVENHEVEAESEEGRVG
jgi:hypothetical protein